MKKLAVIAMVAVSATVAVPANGKSLPPDTDYNYIKCLGENNQKSIIDADPNIIALCLKSTGQQVHSKQEIADKKYNFQQCVTIQAAEFDDYVSPAGDIVKAILNLCDREYHSMISSWNITRGLRSKFSKDEKLKTSMFMQIVLLGRKNQN